MAQKSRNCGNPELAQSPNRFEQPSHEAVRPPLNSLLASRLMKTQEKSN